MNRATKGGLVGIAVAAVSVLQPVTMFVAYAHHLTSVMALAIPIACALHVLLLSQFLRPLGAWTGAIVLTLAGAWVGASYAFNTYGT